MIDISYDVIVVGAGHAGCEAAAVAANMGAKVLLVTIDMERTAQMSCNPAMGGIAKGQIVREIDAMGGYSGIVTDISSIQFRMLNRSKGPAMWSPRSQCDRKRFVYEWRNILESLPSLSLWQDEVVSLIIEGDKVIGVKTKMGASFKAGSVILTNGTFLNGLIHIGRNKTEGGRISEPPSKGLTEQLIELGFESGRMQTGTPARLDGRTIDFSVLTPQYGDTDFGKFSFLPSSIQNQQNFRPCYIAFTNKIVHEILESGLIDSPMYNGTIQSIGPRYCPSIEDKIVTFASKDSHQLFLEPEGVTTCEYYLNGFSSSLPADIQLSAIKKIKGLENVSFFRPGYAIEYDFFPPTQLYHSLETKLIRNLFFAGQINGTTGYEEAAAQGFMAGINAVLKSREDAPFILDRSQAYTGVLIDDLVTKGVDEPYRMFTSRAEYRILLRQDDADMRLTPLVEKYGLISSERAKTLDYKKTTRDNIIAFCIKGRITPEKINPFLETITSSPLRQSIPLRDLILRPEISLTSILEFFPDVCAIINKGDKMYVEIIEAAEILLKYSGYIDREKLLAEKTERLDKIFLKPDFDYKSLKSLSFEARAKLTKIKPSNLGQAARIPGVSPADIQVLIIFLGR